MRWQAPKDQPLRWGFALIPFRVERTWVWLEWYQYRFRGEYYEVYLQEKTT